MKDFGLQWEWEPELLAAYRAGRLRFTPDGLLEVVYPLRQAPVGRWPQAIKWSEESDQIAHLSALLQVLRHAAQRVIDNDAHFAAHPREDDGEWDDCIRSLRNALFPMTPRQPVPGAEATALEDVAQEALAYSGIPSGISGVNPEGTYFSRAELVAALAHSLETLGYTLVGPPLA